MNHGDQKKKKQRVPWIRVCWGLAGIALFMASLLTFIRGRYGLVEIAVPLGFSMLLAGAINILIYCKGGGGIHGSRWLLADGMSTALLSLFLLFNKMILPAMIPFFFGVWELFSGILKVMDSIELKQDRIRGWNWFIGIGLIEIISGIASLLKPVEEFVGMHAVVAIILAIQSCGFLFKILIYPRLLHSSSE